MRRLARGLIAFITFAFTPVAVAQVWPERPVRLIVNFEVGGAPDVVDFPGNGRLSRESWKVKVLPPSIARSGWLAACPDQ